MGRGLDGFLILVVALCSFEGPGGLVSRLFPVALARGKHLFPFRTEQLSPSAPMVLGPQGPGRVGRRRFITQASRPSGRLVAFLGLRELLWCAVGTAPSGRTRPAISRRAIALARWGRGTRDRVAPAHRGDAALVGAAPPHGVGA